jgi:ubiquinone/menaquinone biosynthesis C-methylase UbiE
MVDNRRSAQGQLFADPDVVRAYRHRADYPPDLYLALRDLSPARQLALDLGCGTGKLAIGLADHFAQVIAADPSQPMLDAARQANNRRHDNIEWACATGEALSLTKPPDLVVAGASIHWMDASVVFPKLARALQPEGMLAIIDGDGPSQADWHPVWQAALGRWIIRQGGAWNDDAYRERVTAHEAWFDVMGQASFERSVIQAVDDLIEAQHSRATWARSILGEAAQAFDADLRRALMPFAKGGVVEFTVRSRVTWGRPRRSVG